jgi:hypothetical protein
VFRLRSGVKGSGIALKTAACGADASDNDHAAIGYSD